MKKTSLLITAAFIVFLSAAGCNDLINNMDSTEQLSAEESARALDGFIEIIQINSATGCIFTFDFLTDPDGVIVTISSSSVCTAVESSGIITYSSLNEGEGQFDLIFNGCRSQSNSGTSYTGTITVGLSGSAGSITGFDFTGNITADGEIAGNINIDIHYNAGLSCVSNWDCWSGSVNGYSVDTLSEFIK